MRESIGGISLFQIVIVLIIVFAGIMALTMNHSKAFGVKDEIITIIENDKTASSGTIHPDKIQEIVNHLNDAGYYLTGNCPNEDGWIGYDREGKELNNGKAASFCLRAVNVAKENAESAKKYCKESDGCYVSEDGLRNMYYYDVVLFYQLDIPVVSQFMRFQLKGSTKILVG